MAASGRASARTTVLDEAAAQRVLSRWREHDLARAIHEDDVEAVRTTDAARSLVVELWAASDADRPPRDLYSACANLGRLLADGRASPTLLAGTLDGVAAALAEAGVAPDAERLATARASLAEGYVASARDAERQANRRAWEYPRCAVRLDSETIAIAAGYPGDDAEALSEWAARIAVAVSRDRAKVVVLAGELAPKRELGEALRLVGVAVHESLPARASWLRLPWRK